MLLMAISLEKKTLFPRIFCSFWRRHDAFLYISCIVPFCRTFNSSLSFFIIVLFIISSLFMKLIIFFVLIYFELFFCSFVAAASVLFPLWSLLHPPAARHFWPSGSRLDVFQDSRVRIPSSELLFFQKSALQQPGGLIKINLQCWDCSWMVCLKLRKNSDLGEFGQEGEFCGNWEIRGEKKFRSFQGIYIPCFFCNSRSSFQRVLTPSIMVWTNWISE